jgi:Uri superfamily endonuclease
MSPSLFKGLPEKGVYTLIILMRTSDDIAVGRLGTFTFPKGYYAYTGSAMASLRKRAERHAKKTKTKHWHVDFLLTDDFTELTSAVASSAKQNIECQANEALLAIAGTSIPVPGFGASDCRRGCKSHLIYFGERKPQEKILNAYRTLFGSNVIKASVQAFRN